MFGRAGNTLGRVIDDLFHAFSDEAAPLKGSGELEEA